LSHPFTSFLIETVEELKGEKQATIIGMPMKTSTLNKALVNRTMSHVLNFDDIHLGVFMHPSTSLILAL